MARKNKRSRALPILWKARKISGMPCSVNRKAPTGIAKRAGHTNGPHALSACRVSPVEKASHQYSAATMVKKIIEGIKNNRYSVASTVACVLFDQNR